MGLGCPKTHPFNGDNMKIVNVYLPQTEAQICLMDEETRDEVCGFIPPYEQLCATAPNEEMVEEWKDCEELFKRVGEKHPEMEGFAFNCVYMMKMSCGHYEIFQHPGTRNLHDILDWIERVQVGRKCSRCHCGGA